MLVVEPVLSDNGNSGTVDEPYMGFSRQSHRLISESGDFTEVDWPREWVTLKCRTELRSSPKMSNSSARSWMASSRIVEYGWLVVVPIDPRRPQLYLGLNP
jgi:hypothetical protein